MKTLARTFLALIFSFGVVAASSAAISSSAPASEYGYCLGPDLDANWTYEPEDH